nr:DEAD/DEAH box helicase [Ktedonobacterales bacterium]
MTIHASPVQIPQPGQMVTLRARPALVRDVVSYGTPTLHAVEVEYIDGWDHPSTDRVVWQHERNTRVHIGHTMPTVHRGAPDGPARLLALQHAYRWESLNHLTSARAHDAATQRLISPWQGAVQTEDYQLYPVLKALAMPRVGLLIADDVGLGKTVEAGLILTELIARRRIRRVVILCPAALQQQWHDEMHTKFYLDFAIVDRDGTFKLRREQGIDTNPWNAFSRIITSFDYLRQGTVLQEFQGASNRISQGTQTALPWELLIVDEAHNLAPAAFGNDSQRTEMLRQVAPRCEHRIFLTATPHNGYTLTYTGLLEMLDPVHFQREAPISDSTRRAIQQSVVRRLKEDLNIPGELPRFPRRTVRPLGVQFGAEELALFAAVRQYRRSVLGFAGNRPGERQIANFVVTILTKRLLSSAYAFARTWWQHVEAAPGEVDDSTLATTID